MKYIKKYYGFIFNFIIFLLPGLFIQMMNISDAEKITVFGDNILYNHNYTPITAAVYLGYIICYIVGLLYLHYNIKEYLKEKNTSE